MKVVIINTKRWGGGAAHAALQLQFSLREKGVEAHFFCLYCGEATSGVSCLCRSRRLAKWITTLDRLPLKIGYRRRLRSMFSLNWASNGALQRMRKLQPDIVHLHWPNMGFIPTRALAGLTCPVVWTLHDSWAFTGGCHLPGDCTSYRAQCGRCPELGSSFRFDLSRLGHWNKQRVYPRVELTVVTPSSWLACCARESSLLRDKQIVVIPNGIDFETFRLYPPSELRETGILKSSRQLILFGAMGALSDNNKGFDLLLETLRHFRAKGGVADLAVFGADRLPEGVDRDLLGGGEVKLLGEIHDPVCLARIYAAADVMVVPSRSENLPFTVLESLACGTPVAAFDVGGISEILTQKECGYLATPYNCEELAEGILGILQRASDSGDCRELLHELMQSRYSLDTLAERHLDLYRGLLSQGR
jgi:glycosyltransferase involved in cell wall biosynthesis